MSLDTESKKFWDGPDLEGELKRVFDICNGCRRCYNLCPSFNDLFGRLDRDEVDGDAEKLNAADLKSVTDLYRLTKAQGVSEVLVGTALFTGLWLFSAFLFGRAAKAGA